MTISCTIFQLARPAPGTIQLEEVFMSSYVCSTGMEIRQTNSIESKIKEKSTKIVKGKRNLTNMFLGGCLGHQNQLFCLRASSPIKKRAFHLGGYLIPYTRPYLHNLKLFLSCLQTTTRKLLRRCFLKISDVEEIFLQN